MRASPPEPRAATPAGQWLLVNGLGCIAAGTGSGGRVRPGLAALSLRDPWGSLAEALQSLDTRAIVDSRTYALDPLDTDPHVHSVSRAEIESFTATDAPEWIYRAGPARIARRLFLLHDQQALVVVLSHREGPDARVVVTPVFAVAPRDPGAEVASPLTQTIPGRLRVMSGAGSLTVWHDGAFLPTRAWQAAGAGVAAGSVGQATEEPHREAEARRGAVAGFIEATLGVGGRLHVVIAADEALLRRLAEVGRLGTPPPRTLRGCVEMIEASERSRHDPVRRRALGAAGDTAREAMTARSLAAAVGHEPIGDDDPWVPRLARAIAWDAWIPGEPPRGTEATRRLRQVRALVTLRAFEEAREVLLGYGQLVRDGLVPSGLENAGRRYDDPEPSLWLVIATELFARRTGEHEFVLRALFPALEQVIEHFRAGTAPGVRLGEQGLLLNRLGARFEARADLNALWYTAQAAIGQLAKMLGNKQSGAFYVAWAREHQARALEHLWDASAGTLHAALGSAGPRGEVSPSLVLAASLSPPLLPPDQACSLLAHVERELLTPAGLRESPGSPRVLTEWMGPFLSAWVRAHGRSEESQRQASEWAARFEQTVDACSAGCVPETFELAEDSARRGEGRPISVLATAEMTRFWVEELDPEFRERARHAET